MPKVTDDKMEQIIKTLKECSFAINALQRTQLHTDVDMFVRTKSNTNNLIEELESRYKLLKNV